jgi:Mg-chelatase subunit ChlD
MARMLAQLGFCAALIASSVSSLSSASAQPAFHESEPNDVPETANAVSGAVRIVGAMPDGDQDGFLWTVSDVDATMPWSFSFQGVPGTLSVAEVIRLDHAADGKTLTGRKTLFTLGSRDGSRPAVADNLLFEPGAYLLGVARAGSGGPYRPPTDSVGFGAPEKAEQTAKPGSNAEADDEGYRLAIEHGKSYAHSGAAADNGRKERAIALNPGRRVSAYASGDESWYRFTLDAKSAANRWDLSAQVPVGRRAVLELAGAKGTKLAEAASDRRGAMKLPDLSLAAGSYLVKLKGETDSLHALALEQAGLRVDGEEAEPNDQWAHANRAGLDSPLRGRFQRRGDDDHFAFELGPEAADRRLALEVAAAPGSRYDVCLLDQSGSPLQCRTGAGDQRLGSLVLEPGVHGVRLGRGVEGMTYTLRLVEEGPRAPGLEAEPNDSAALATSAPAKLRIKGSLTEGDQDFIRFDLAGEAQLWRFQVNGTGIHEVAYHDGAGARAQAVRAQPDQRRIVLDKLFLLPGTHYIAVSGRADGDYTLLARPLGAPDENGEIEPNDDPTRMQPIRIGQTRTGLLPDLADRDNYRLHLADHDHVRLSISPPPDGQIRALLHWDGKSVRESRSDRTGEALVLEGLFPPGDYRLELIAAKPSDAEYRIEFARLDRFACAGDCEPNDNLAFARGIPPDRILRGRVGEWRDDDWYALPVFEADTALAIRVEQRQNVALLAHGGDRDALVRDKSGEPSGVIPAGAQRYLRVRGDGEYRMALSIGGEAPPSQPVVALPVALDLELAAREVAAYRPFGQRIDGRVTLRNTGTEAVSVTLDATTSDARWRAAVEPQTLRIPGAATASAALRLAVPDDAWADRPVRVSVRARDASGAGGAGGTMGTAMEAGVDVVARRDIDPVQPVAHWEVPDALRGGFNLAWRALGGRWLGKQDDRIGLGLGDIFDGMAVREEGLLLRGSNTPSEYQTIVELAGSGDAEIAGFVLDPLGKRSASEYLRRFRIALSEDGKQFETVVDGVLEPLPREQYFVLDRPRKARFARLSLIDDHAGNLGAGRALGEWKVVARPGYTPFARERINVADPRLGGHVVRASPTISPKWDDALLDPKSAPARIRLRAGESLDWVVGFQHDRAAMIDGIEWVDVADAGKQALIEEVRIFASRDSPLGPWEPLATWKLAGGQAKRLALERPTWARFVRFATAPADKAVTLVAPSMLRIFERPVAADYLSILGEWGFNGHQAVYEAQHPPKPPPRYALSGHGSREQAAELELGKAAEGRVWLGRHEHWYRVQVPAGRNALEIELAGEPTGRTVATIETASGERVETRLLERGPAAQRLEARVEAGQTLFVKVEEPPRNVVFAWDTSASVGAYLPVIYNTIAAYARDLVPGRDAANLMPFGSGLLLATWHGEPWLLQKILNEHPRKESSSEAETTLARASAALAERAGAKAIVLITDAATNRDAALWRVFDEVRPRVMALGLDSHGAFGRNPVLEQDLLQDWARVNSGHYSHLRSEGEMEVAFDRAATLLREPAPYRLTVSAEFREPLKPGRLQVMSGAAVAGAKGRKPAAGNAVALILDASGSMLQRMQGERRIDVARRGLVEAVTRHIAPGTPVALRVFGHRQANACRTDLEIPLAPLDPAATKRAIERIEARNLARTPIADSLAKVETDLAKAAGARTIVLVTDGEETCGGDAEAVIRKMQDKGIDFRLNIIGFALADDTLEARFAELAELGGGHYFRAADADGFRLALGAALKTPFSVFDRDGTELARGLVDGDAVELPAGDYRVVVMTAESRRFDGVRVPPGGEARVRLE